MENGGTSLFDFITRAHSFIANGKIKINDWHQSIKLMFKQMVEAIDYIHDQNVCHFDISLENILISDVQINVDNHNGNITFLKDSIQVKLCDFGM